MIPKRTSICYTTRHDCLDLIRLNYSKSVDDYYNYCIHMKEIDVIIEEHKTWWVNCIVERSRIETYYKTYYV